MSDKDKAAQPAQNSGGQDKQPEGLRTMTSDDVHNFHMFGVVNGRQPRDRDELEAFVAEDQDD